MRAPLRLVAPWTLLWGMLAAWAVIAVVSWQPLVGIDPKAWEFGAFLVFPVAAAVGAYRAWFFHPAYRKDYRDWLASTPWDVSRPLPFGPIELDWPDAIVPALLIASYGLLGGRDSIRVLAVFLFAHVVVLVPTFWRSANHVHAYAALFGLGLMVRIWSQPWACSVTGVVVYLVAYAGVRETLKDLDWAWTPWAALKKATSKETDPDLAACGWPYDRLIREPDAFPATWGDVESKGPGHEGRSPAPTWVDDVIWSLLVGWWASCAGGVLRPDPHAFVLGVASFILVMAGVGVRSSLYQGSFQQSFYQSPVNLWGRIWTGRWLIPGHDVCFLGPALTLLVPPTVFLASGTAGVPWQVAGPMVPSVALLVALRTPPGLRRWRLAGRHRISTNAAERAKRG